nr:dihydrofolate reductase family protein [Actinomycetota bacterium]
VDYLRAAPGEPLHFPDVLARLRAEHGVRSVLSEGGPHLNRSLLPDGLVDEMFLTIVPKIAGGAGGLGIVSGEEFATPLELELRWLLECKGELYTRYAVLGHRR